MTKPHITSMPPGSPEALAHGCTCTLMTCLTQGKITAKDGAWICAMCGRPVTVINRRMHWTCKCHTCPVHQPQTTKGKSHV